MMRTVATITHVVMASWMLLGSALRVAIQVTHGYDIDALPFLSATLAFSALLVLLLAPNAQQAFYVVLAVWLVIGSAARVVLQLTRTTPLDPLPFISVALGLTGVSVAFAALTEYRA